MWLAEMCRKSVLSVFMRRQTVTSSSAHAGASNFSEAMPGSVQEGFEEVAAQQVQLAPPPPRPRSGAWAGAAGGSAPGAAAALETQEQRWVRAKAIYAEALSWLEQASRSSRFRRMARHACHMQIAAVYSDMDMPLDALRHR